MGFEPGNVEGAGNSGSSHHCPSPHALELLLPGAQVASLPLGLCHGVAQSPSQTGVR